MRDDLAILCPVRPDGLLFGTTEEEAKEREPAGHEERGEGEVGMMSPAEEARESKPARDPGAPTAAMLEAHEPTHLPFRIWCATCVAGSLAVQ